MNRNNERRVGRSMRCYLRRRGSRGGARVKPILHAGLDPHTLRFVADEAVAEGNRIYKMGRRWHGLWLSSRRDTDHARFMELTGIALSCRKEAIRYRKLATRIETARGLKRGRKC